MRQLKINMIGKGLLKDLIKSSITEIWHVQPSIGALHNTLFLYKMGVMYYVYACLMLINKGNSYEENGLLKN